MKETEIEIRPIDEDLLKIITPSGIELKRNQIQIDNYLSYIQYISSFPSSVNLGWITNLKDIPNTQACILVTPIDDVQAYIDGISKRNYC